MSFLADRSGTTAIEYALIAGMVTIVLITAFSDMTGPVAIMYGMVVNLFN